MDYRKEAERWRTQVTGELLEELENMTETETEDAFYRDLAFGTGGLRGTIGVGTNRMNVFTVAKATQGLANYLNKCFSNPVVVIGYDSRIRSDEFAKVAAGVLAANGIGVRIWPWLLPVPTVSFAVRFFRASAGIMITASHNPSRYNGYKVYGPDGCQITTEAAETILTEINGLDIFTDVKQEPFTIAPGRTEYIGEDVLTAYIGEVRNQSLAGDAETDRNVSIVYTPLNGTGRIPVTRVLEELGYTHVTVVKEQEMPDGHFPTCPYPNPEIREAMALGIEYARRVRADLLLATDPDCDRVGIAVRNRDGEYVLLTGNETGLLLLDYICSARKEQGKMPADPVMVKTIVTTDLAERIAAAYGVRTVNVLTGFKFIGEQIGLLEKQGKEDSYIFGFEESYGCLTGTYVRDKDGVNGAAMICEMFARYAAQGISLTDKLEELYSRYGYCMNTLYSYEFDGPSGFRKMQEIMAAFRRGLPAVGPKKVLQTLDYSMGLDGLPESDVLKFLLEDNCAAVVRPSGTEPKLKVYLSVSAENREEAAVLERRMKEELDRFFA